MKDLYTCKPKPVFNFALRYEYAVRLSCPMGGDNGNKSDFRIWILKMIISPYNNKVDNHVRSSVFSISATPTMGQQHSEEQGARNVSTGPYLGNKRRS